MINQSVAGGIKGASRAVITAVIAFVVSIMLFATTAFAEMVSAYNVDIAIDNERYTITTNETEPIEILSKANVKLTADDKLDISGFRAGQGGVIAIDRLKTVNVSFDKNIETYQVYGDTVKEAVDELGLSVKNDKKINYDFNDAVVDGMIIKIKSAGYVTLKINGKSTKYPITNGTVGDLLQIANVSLGEDDFTTPSRKTRLKRGMKVKINKVEYKTQTKTEKVKYSTTKKEDRNLYKGIQKVVTEGVHGKAKVTYNVKYVNGKQISKSEIDRDVIKQPKKQVVKVGARKTDGTTKIKANGVTKKNGFKVGQKITGRFTHYCACGTCGSGTGRTASGKKVWNGMKDPYYIACNWLPLGSVVNIDGTNYTVVDRGGSGLSRVGRVDIFTPEGHKACYRYGTGSCDLTIIRIGW